MTIVILILIFQLPAPDVAPEEAAPEVTGVELC